MRRWLLRLAGVLASILAAILIAELAGLVLMRALPGRLPSRASVQETLAAPAAAADEGPEGGTDNDFATKYVLNPYLGFTRIPGESRIVALDRPVEIPTNVYGFLGDPPPPAANDEEFTVILLGGSVAAELYLLARSVLESELRASPGLAGKDLRLVCLALGGFKQPQQLHALTQFLALGADLDVVVNLDGFNEVALTLANNFPAGVAYFYPRKWNLMVRRSLDDRQLAAWSRLAATRRRIESTRSFFSRSPWRHSSLALLAWHNLHNRLKTRLAALEEDLQPAPGDQPTTAEETGPWPEILTREEYLEASVALWQRSSLQMWRLAEAGGIRYYHFLQANQYVPGSKELTEEELRQAFASPQALFRRAVEEGYPLLSGAGRELAEMGAAFQDLTMIFRDRPETIYTDRCCHYNRHGYSIVARRIAATIRRDLESPPPGGP